MMMWSRMRDWSRRRPRTSQALAGFLIVVSVVAFVLWESRRDATTAAASGNQQQQQPNATMNPFQDLYNYKKNSNDTNNKRQKCQETFYQPFLVGCPAECSPYRKDLGRGTVDANATLYYRLTIGWYLGQPQLKLHLPVPQPNTYYDMGYNYQCPKEFVDAFGQASDALEQALLKPQPEPIYNSSSGLVVKTQARMHLSLAYLCCLTLEEAYHVREIMQEFVHSNTFSIPNITFERIECWKERFNSITHIIVVDNTSQQRLLALLYQLETAIQHAGIPVPISRLTQMPFHTTLLGVQKGSQKYSTNPQDDIDPILPLSFQALEHINRNIWPTNGISMNIQHLPKYSEKPVWQTTIETQ